MLAAADDAAACTNFIITKGASTDGSVMVSYAADSHTLYGSLYKYNAPKKPYPAGTMLAVYEWDSGRYLGEIPQSPVTYSTVGNMNEHQLVIGETTFGGRAKLEDPNGGIMDYGSLIYITLQRAKTAREAILTIVELANAHGYPSSGESFSIADPEDAWIMELIGKGPGRKGIVWVARRIPDGYVCAHANQARITQFPKDDPENCLYALDVVSFAREMGFYEGSDEDFSFSDTYNPINFGGARYCEARVWSFFRAITPGMDRYTDYAMGHDLTNRMPLWVKPTQKISPKQVFDFMRDHYEGTPMDMTRDIGAGGHNLPYRWRPMQWKADGVEYLNERATATQQTGFWFVGQSRSWLPDPVGGILWFGTDDAATSPLTPIYCSTTEVPWCFSDDNGHMTEYSPTSMFWLTNRISNFAYLRYDRIGADVRREVDKWENGQLEKVKEVDNAASQLYGKKPAKSVKYVTDYTIATAQELFDHWNWLDKYLLVKYMDGNVKKEGELQGSFRDNGNGANIPETPDFPGYDVRWRRNVASQDDGTLRVH